MIAHTSPKLTTWINIQAYIYSQYKKTKEAAQDSMKGKFRPINSADFTQFEGKV